MALALAVLYFGLIELLMIDATRELSAARRFRSNIVALTLAENAAELAALNMVTRDRTPVDEENDQGRMLGDGMRRAGLEFDIQVEGHSAGLEPASMTVRLEGHIDDTTLPLKVIIDYSRHYR